MNLLSLIYFILASMESLDLVSPYLFKYKRRNFLVGDKLRPEDIDALQHVDIRPTDIFLVTYPKSGQLLTIIVAMINNYFYVTQLIISIHIEQL